MKRYPGDRPIWETPEARHWPGVQPEQQQRLATHSPGSPPMSIERRTGGGNGEPARTGSLRHQPRGIGDTINGGGGSQGLELRHHPARGGSIPDLEPPRLGQRTIRGPQIGFRPLRWLSLVHQRDHQPLADRLRVSNQRVDRRVDSLASLEFREGRAVHARQSRQIGET